MIIWHIEGNSYIPSCTESLSYLGSGRLILCDTKYDASIIGQLIWFVKFSTVTHHSLNILVTTGQVIFCSAKSGMGIKHHKVIPTPSNLPSESLKCLATLWDRALKKSDMAEGQDIVVLDNYLLSWRAWQEDFASSKCIGLMENLTWNKIRKDYKRIFYPCGPNPLKAPSPAQKQSVKLTGYQTANSFWLTHLACGNWLYADQNQ